MKIRLAKKIMNSKRYRVKRFFYGVGGDLNIRDHRITKAIILTKRWNERKIRNDAKKPFQTNHLWTSIQFKGT